MRNKQVLRLPSKHLLLLFKLQKGVKMLEDLAYKIIGVESKKNKLNQDNLIKYFIKKYTNTGSNVGPTAEDIPNAERDDYDLVFNKDGSIKDLEHNMKQNEHIDENFSDEFVEDILKDIRSKDSFIIFNEFLDKDINLA